MSYQGRAASMAEAGNYLLIIKRDGSVQIHHPKGIKPLNWQPKTDRLHAQVEEGYCVFTASRKSPDETVRMVMLNVARRKRSISRKSRASSSPGPRHRCKRPSPDTRT